jgi:hypothetical protein
MFNCVFLCSLHIYCDRAASQVAKEILLAINFLWLVNIFVTWRSS